MEDLEPWNNRHLLAPPVHTALCSSKIDIKSLNYTLNNMINILTKQSPLHNESAICSRLIYKFDKKFRNDIGYRSLKKVNCALRRYLLINLLRDIRQFLTVLPDEADIPYYLPTRQMLEYLLIKVIAFSKLMSQLVVCSKQAAVFYLDRVKRGESHWMSLMPYALLSRVWSMTYVLLQHSCSWYQLLYPYLDKLQLKGLNFLPTNYTLPVNLGEWLELKDLNNFGRFEWTKKEAINIDPVLANDDKDDFENILEYVSKINEEKEINQGINDTLEAPKNDKIKIIEIDQLQVSHEDCGEAISRDSFEKVNNDKYASDSAAIRKNDYFHVIDQVTNKISLQKFINNEEIFRNEGNGRSLTTHLSFMQWHALKQSLLKLDSLTLNNRKLQRKFNKIWQEKCLDS